MMDLTIDLAEAQSDNDCDEPAPTKGQFKRARRVGLGGVKNKTLDLVRLHAAKTFLQFSKMVSFIDRKPRPWNQIFRYPMAVTFRFR